MTRHLTVVPVVDYEPAPVPVPARARPPHARSRRGTPGSPPSPAALHRATPRGLRPVATPEPPSARAAAAFADAALRRVLEVVDRRRAMAQLRPLLAVGLLDSVVALARSSPGGESGPAAVLRRVRLRVVDRDGEAAEVFATYSRGGRVRAIAGRVELVTVRGIARWQVVALQIG